MRLTGYLTCQGTDELSIVVEHMPRHVTLTRAEPGCVSFEVTQSDDPFVWHVDEEFVDMQAFAVHQRRVASSDWGRLTSDIQRQYDIEP